jgi:hypothetical protein
LPNGFCAVDDRTVVLPSSPGIEQAQAMLEGEKTMFAEEANKLAQQGPGLLRDQ